MVESRPHDGFAVRIRDITGTAYGLWRCGSCGETGRLRQSLPASCPGCGGPREALEYVAED
jgi:rubrerythrin